MKKKRLPFHQLVKKNKEELMKDKTIIEEIEKKLEEKHADKSKAV
ncbi:FbpB family small basic protein [Pseudobacillus wudalianchiensis]|nr:FbpB family small basic protein [Bacillus wudalianchiensis]